MHLDDFDYPLPEHLIATRPMVPRRAARLLVAEGGGLRDLTVGDLPDVLRPGDRLVVNDTRVLPARLTGIRRRATRDGSGTAQVEVTLLQPVAGGAGADWRALARPLRRLAAGDVINFGALGAEVLGRGEADAVLRFDRTGDAFEAALAEAGQMPLPPYIAARRAPDTQDRADYQTVFAARPGAVAAPTASLHFDAGLMAALAARGVALSRVTLHVGAGTFLPVKVDDIARHRMHAEWAELGEAAATEIARTRAEGGRILAVGTTALRTLETAARGGTIEPFTGETDIFIRPGHVFRAVDGLMTNFHLPKSTLMMLVAALMGLDRIKAIYAHAIAREYRFFSYGDASLLIPER